MKVTKIKPTTFRIDPQIKAGLEQLSEVTRVSQNDLVNLALKNFVNQQTLAVATELEDVANKLKAYRLTDPNFETAIAAIAKSESSNFEDPVEGALVKLGSQDLSFVKSVLNA